MTDDTTTPSDDIEFVRLAGQTPSELLLTLSLVYQHVDNSVPLSLSLPGGVLFGRAVHRSVWLRAMAEQARSVPTAPESTGPETVGELFDKLAERRAEVVFDDEKHTLDDIVTIYLVDAWLVGPQIGNQAFQTRSSCWQVPVAKVDAWTFGIPHDIKPATDD
ncbi:hypothetical protein [Pseudonocardia alni]|uniref:hypothetical protein n=1 Tax=Pseudonocardia alni TaxID=33907 RepID=UPI0033EAB2F5